MAGPLTALSSKLTPAFAALAADADPVLRPSAQPGVDFQANGALGLAKRLGRPPAELAAAAVAGADLTGICRSVQVSPQGFINLTLDEGWLAGQVVLLAADSRLGRPVAERAARIVVDYSSPNVAKEMHAGHLRSTIIGDAVCRMLADAGHDLVRANHVGDWGTQFGMLIEQLVEAGGSEAGLSVEDLSAGDLNAFYQQARARFEGSSAFAERSRARVVALQGGDPDTLRLWRALVAGSVEHFSALYDELGVQLRAEDVVGESFYNDQLPAVVADLEALGLLVESDGARCVFPPGFTNRDGEPLPLIVQKSDGGYGYATTDLAAIRYRFERVGADRVLYVVGAPQAQHLAMVFAVARAAGWLPEPGAAVHVAFGSVLGPDGRMFRTRAGETIRLHDLVVEAVERAATAVAEKNPDLDEATAARVARSVGVGALKYADLSTDRTRDYVFAWDRMLAFEGNTAPYLQYAHARIQSIFRRAELEAPHLLGGPPPRLAEPAERALAVALLGFGTAVEAASATYSPHKLCTYLFDLAGAFTSFYETCPVLQAEEPAVRAGRLLLSSLAASVLRDGLGLLGIDAPDRM